MSGVVGRAVARARAQYPVAPGSIHCRIIEVDEEFDLYEGTKGDWFTVLEEAKPKRKQKAEATDDLA